ncbi:MAG: hypothetical protein K2O48_06830 [Prevotella sp.]|nr:hypothetical protein [Prevotella sp.]
MEANEALVALLQKSHAQAVAGQTLTMDEVERFMHDKVYELTHPMDTYCVAEPL